MKVTEVQTYSVSYLVNAPFASVWSEDNQMALITEKGIHILGDRYKSSSLKLVKSLLCLLLTVTVLVSKTAASDITGSVFGKDTDYLPAAFGDFNSDEYTDLFVLRDKAHTLEILLGQDVEPLLRPAGLKCTFSRKITSVVPGDFDGDALMDVMITLASENRGVEYGVHILWGGLNHLNCSHEDKPVITVIGQPLAIDCDQNMIIDLFGVDVKEHRTIWVFNSNRTAPLPLRMPKETNNSTIRIPHSNAFLDLNEDSSADLFITTEKNFEIWLGSDSCKGFHPEKEIDFPPGVKSSSQLGQTVFQDFELEGKIDHLVPVCFNEDCSNSTIYIYSSNKWHNLKLNLHDGSNAWSFVSPLTNRPYLNTLTLRPGDFNMDGYPDLLATLKLGDQYKSFFLENIECTSNCDGYARTFAVRWNALSPYNNETVLGVFYDFLQDGILDVIFVHYKYPDVYNVSAFRNSLDYDANFVKVMVVTGLINKDQPLTIGPLGKKRRTYGTNLPGPRVSYRTTTQEGKPRAGAAVQIPQSAHFSLNLPYTIFGLGRTPNFVDSLTVGVYGNHRVWTQLIPNSQMVIIPWPTDDPSQWRVQLFVTPSKLIFQSIVALLGTCVVILIIIGVLYWKERREDHFEKLQEAHKFHFDAM